MYIYCEEDIHLADQTAARNGLSVNALMETSGRSLFEEIQKLINNNSKILILAGRGNNGGDGIVLARYLLQNGYHAELVFPFGLPKTNAAQEHFRYYQSLGFPYFKKLDITRQYDCIVDSLLGVGTRLPLRNDYLEIIEWCNQQSALRIAVDLPTGVSADHGTIDVAFQANYTFCLHGFKPSAFLLPSAPYFGNSKALDIGLPQTSNWKVLSDNDIKQTLPIRERFSHKGTYGTGLLIAGTDEMPGSALLAGLGAMRLGIGKLMIGTTKYAAQIIATRLPEATFWFNGLEKSAKGELPTGIRAVAIGPGLTNESLIKNALEYLWQTNLPLILDAGALIQKDFKKREAPVVITPHPGEFSRLTGLGVQEIQANRIQIASQFAQKHHVTVVLKGNQTVIAYPDGSGFINPTGNSGLAKGGTGDTLTGMLLAFISSGGDFKEQVKNAVYLHGLCADEFSKEFDARTLIASDLTNEIGTVLKRFKS